ncbi:hypothetical protein HD554DRAFT_1992315, partial [Boletus coccyginus]
VCGSDIERIFEVKISKMRTVTTLKKAIKNEKLMAFHNMNADTLDLYKPRNPVGEPYKENLRQIILLEHVELLEFGPHQLSGVFPNIPPECNIRIIVDAPYLMILGWLQGSTLDARFQIPIRADATMSQLKHHIREAEPNLRNIADQHICLYRTSEDENELQESLDKMGDGE